MTRWLASGLLAFFFACAPAMAQTAADQDPAKIALGGEIFDLTAGKLDFQSALANLPLPPPPAGSSANAADQRQQRLATVAKVMVEMRPQMRAAYAAAFAQNFSLQELQGLKDFYAGPLGTKLAAEQPVISKDVMTVLLPQILVRLMAQMPPPAAPAPQPSNESAPKQ